MKNICLAFLMLFCFLEMALGQDDLYEELKNTEMSIPSAPAFAMLGVNPEIVLRPSDLKSFNGPPDSRGECDLPDEITAIRPGMYFF